MKTRPSSRLLPLVAVLVAGSFGCGESDPQGPLPPPISLSVAPAALLRVELPESSRPDGAAAPNTLPLGPWEPLGVEEGVRAYRGALPFDQVYLGESTRNGPVGMKLLDPRGEPIPYRRGRGAKGPEGMSWRLDEREIQLRVPADGPAPEGLTARFPRAVAWENGLNRAQSGVEGEAFALRRTELGHDDWRGLFLPAPGRAEWAVTVPAGGALGLQARILSPAVDEGEGSDGAVLEVTVGLGEQRERVGRLSLEAGQAWERGVFDLSAYGGRDVVLGVESRPGETALLDYVFVADPVVYVPSTEPRRVVFLFVDTLRRDHVGMYGYTERATTPVLDAWARDAVVFERARSNAPWTLPSVQGLLSGRSPHEWEAALTLPELLEDAGFATTFLSANPYLKPSFGMDRGWTRYRFRFMATAEQQVDAALETLERYPDRDMALMVQFMDPHLPYTEPRPFRRLWVGARPEELQGQVSRDKLVALELEPEALARVRPWVVARYDQNVRYVDAQIERLLERLDEDDIVVFFSDHGEEFWEHGGVEHGHTVYEELLAVPLAIRAPGLPPGRVASPVSLADVAPTVAELLGLELPAARGVSLVGAARGEWDGDGAFTERFIPFGHTLYGDEAWGVLSGHRKWFIQGERELSYDLGVDPAEAHALAWKREERESFSTALARSTGCAVHAVWRVEGQGLRKSTEQRHGSVSLSHPLGFEQAWDTPGIRKETATPVIEAGRVVVKAGGGKRIPREFYATTADPGAPPDGLEIVVDTGSRVLRASWGEEVVRSGDAALEVGKGKGAYRLTRALAPNCGEVAQVEPDLLTVEQLRELGYIE